MIVKTRIAVLAAILLCSLVPIHASSAQDTSGSCVDLDGDAGDGPELKVAAYNQSLASTLMVMAGDGMVLIPVEFQQI